MCNWDMVLINKKDELDKNNIKCYYIFMPKFYEIKLMTACGYIALVAFSFISFCGGWMLPMGLAFIPIPFLLECVITIYYIKISVENKSIHFLCFSIIIFFVAFFVGMQVDKYQTDMTRKYLINISNIIEEYKFVNEINYLTDNDINNINLPENIYFENMGNDYILRYKDGIYMSDTRTVNFRPRP